MPSGEEESAGATDQLRQITKMNRVCLRANLISPLKLKMSQTSTAAAVSAGDDLSCLRHVPPSRHWPAAHLGQCAVLEAKVVKDCWMPRGLCLNDELIMVQAHAPSDCRR
jgi:hypothetical protein